MNGPELARRAGTSYRCIDHWARKGYITVESVTTTLNGRASANRDPAAPGSGSSREFSPTESAVCCRMAALVRVGMRPDVAAVAAREWVLGGRAAAYLGEGMVVCADADPGPGPAAGSGYLGLVWAAEHEQHLHRWSVVGRDPGATRSVVAILDVRASVGDSAEEIARVFAQLANDIPEGAGALMGADLIRQKEIDRG